MSRAYIKTFSKLHQKAIQEGRLVLSLPNKLRKRIWLFLCDYNETQYVQPDPNDRWTDTSDIATEIIPKLCRLYGEETLEARHENGHKGEVDLKGFVAGCYPNRVFDVIQLWYDDLSPDRRLTFQRELNEILEEESCPWCFCDRDFFQMDSKFLEERVQAQVHELLKTQNFFGAMQELVEARNDFAAADFKDTIYNAGKAFESVMKTILKKDNGVAGDLIKDMNKAGILDNLPEKLRHSFQNKVLQSVPFLRNELAAHGQGQQRVEVSRELAELCLNLSASIILFCMRRHLILNPPPPVASIKSKIIEDDIPF